MACSVVSYLHKDAVDIKCRPMMLFCMPQCRLKVPNELHVFLHTALIPWQISQRLQVVGIPVPAWQEVNNILALSTVLMHLC